MTDRAIERDVIAESCNGENATTDCSVWKTMLGIAGQKPLKMSASANSGSTRMKFKKMHGLGNDFVVVDSRGTEGTCLGHVARKLGDRRTGVGFDQLAEIRESESCDASIRFWNSDGSVSATCGNATRCIARLLMQETGLTSLLLETSERRIRCEDAGMGQTRVNMGHPRLDWRDIPLSEEMDTVSLPIEGSPVALGMGNPHCVFFVDDVESVDVRARGRSIERHPFFPERTNVEFVSVVSKSSIRLRIWERGAGLTRASGSGACAAAVAAARTGKTGRNVSVETDGGFLLIEWTEDGVWKTGPTEFVFEGTVRPEWLGVSSPA